MSIVYYVAKYSSTMLHACVCVRVCVCVYENIELAYEWHVALMKSRDSAALHISFLKHSTD